jgi:hypothetical protein
MKVKQLFICFLAASWLLVSCDKNDCNNRQGDYSKGVFVVNEGPFGGTGTITWHDPATGETVQDVYESENCGATLGQFVQSLTFHNGKGYIVVNGANKIVVVDAKSFQYIGVIEGFALPRFFLPIDNQFAYVSQWGLDGLSGSLAKVDLVSKMIVKTIPVGSGPEKMVRAGDRVFVANGGGYGLDSTIAEVSVLSDAFVTTYPTTGKNPSSLVLENLQNPNPLYLCKGYYLESSPMGNLNVLQGGVAGGIAVPPYSDDLLRDESGVLFFTANTKIYRVVNNNGQYDVTPLFDQNAYGLGLDATENLLYCADAKDFSTAGEVVVRAFDGSVMGSFAAGIAPGEILVVE